MNDLKPLITIVTVVYNAVNTISDTINSVILQTYDNIQYIIIDGGSNDGTLEKINFYSENISIFITENDNGIFDAMNKGLFLATGVYINFMNSGDLFADNKVIENIVMKNNIDADFIYGDTIVNKRGKLKLQKANPFFKKTGIHSMGICHQSIFIKTNLVKKYTFDTSLKLTADYKLIYLIFKNEKPITLYLDFPVSIFDSSYGITSMQYRKTFREIIDIHSSKSFISKLIFITRSYIRYSFSSIYNFVKNL